MGQPTLKFQHFQAIPDLTFWTEFTKLKLQKLKLAETALPIQGHYTSSTHDDVPGPLKLDESSCKSPPQSTTDSRVAAPGELLNYNTIEGFKKVDRAALLKQTAQKIVEDIKSGTAEQEPSLLCRYLLTSYADLKSYKFFYWFAFPALKLPELYKVEDCQRLDQFLGSDGANELASRTEESLNTSGSRPPFWFSSTAVESSDESPMHCVRPLSDAADVTETEVYVCMMDPSSNLSEPGWPLRNLLFMAAWRWRWRSATIICWRTRRGRLSPDCSSLFKISIPSLPQDWEAEPEVTGWAPNPKGVLGPRMVNLGTSMDPHHFAASAADLNIRLMKWRAAPGLDVDKLAATKCLLLGAGTLGCAVARTLLGWGVKTITFVDNSRVSYSNPVRQSLYEFEDCQGGGLPKAQAAAEKLRKIFPVVHTEGVQMNIPMPGHPLSDTEIEEAKQNAKQLEELIQLHDVVFLLMDTRESRWLPTLLAAVHHKLAINAALGFDSYLVMRHGGAPDPGVSVGSRLGCYYCNDIIAPLNSTVDRTLDQQCTVARPGLAPIAGALAVEMMAAVVQHPDGVRAPAGRSSAQSPASEAPLGEAPHMIRGQMGTFSQLSLTGQAFSQCTACSQAVVDCFKSGGWDWLYAALQDPKKLEDLTGLTEMMQKMASVDSSDGSNDGLVALNSDDDDFEEI